MLAITTFGDRPALMRAAADRIAESLQNAIKTRGSACAALSGGSTPAPAYEALAALPLAWPNVTFALVDERFVPPREEASNQRLLEHSLAPALASGAQLIPMYAPAATIADAAAQASAAYDQLHIGVAVLGMGEDGHTASWFPGARGLAEALAMTAQASVVAVHAPQAAGAADRLTLTLPAVLAADRRLLLITGDAKRQVLERAFAGPPEAAPVAALFRDPARQPEVLWAP